MHANCDPLARGRKSPRSRRTSRRGADTLRGRRGRLPHLPHPVAHRRPKGGACSPSARAARTAAATPATSTSSCSRSTDGGKTWGKTAGRLGRRRTTPAATRARSSIAKTGTIWLLLTHNLGSDTEAKIVAGTSKGTRTVWVTKSTDDGATWAKPVEITKDVKKPDWTWYATGPGVGIQLKSGRLVIPCDNKSDGGKVRAIARHLQRRRRARRGSSAAWSARTATSARSSSWPTGRLMLNMRSYHGNNRRLVATSKDGGETFTKPVEDAT